MTRQEIEDEAGERARTRRFADHPLLPHAVTLTVGAILNAFIVAFVAGQAFQRIDGNSDDIAMMRTNASPAAAQAIGEIRVFDQSLDRRVSNLEVEIRSQRAEMLNYLQRIDQNVRDHVTGGK